MNNAPFRSATVRYLLAVSTLLAMIPAAAAFASEPEPALKSRLVPQFGKSVAAATDGQGRFVVSGLSGWRSGKDIRALSAAIFDSLKRSVWKSHDFKILETKVETSRFGSTAFSSVTLHGYPVIDKLLTVRTSADGSLDRFEFDLPYDEDGSVVSPVAPKVSLTDAAYTICGFAAEHLDGYVCPGSAQQVWFVDAQGLLAPGARMILNSATMMSMKEAVVDLRTGKLVRFVERARIQLNSGMRGVPAAVK